MGLGGRHVDGLRGGAQGAVNQVHQIFLYQNKIFSSIRFIAGMWYLFTLIMVSSYTANLAASLTAENLNTPISEVEDLT